MNEAIENPGDESIISSKRVAWVAPERAFREQQQEDLRAYKRMLHDKKAAARDASALGGEGAALAAVNLSYDDRDHGEASALF